MKGEIFYLVFVSILALSLQSCGGSTGSTDIHIEQIVCNEEIQTEEGTICISETVEVIPVLPEE